MQIHDLHIGDFYNDVARILVTLYMHFPVRSALYVEDISGPDTPDEYGLHSPRHMACFSAALWLAEENYFRFTGTIQQDALDEAVLSQASFLFFTAKDEHAGYTRIAMIKKLLDEKSSSALNNYLQETLNKFAQQQINA